MGEKDLSNKDLLDKINELINGSSTRIRQEIKKEYDELKIILAEAIKHTEELENKCKSLKSRSDYLEKISRKNNIVIFGLATPERGPLLQIVIQTLSNILEVDLAETDINNIYRLKSEKTPTLKVEFVRYLKKQEILENCFKLKGHNIYISQDLSPNERLDRKILLEHRNRARSKNLQARIVGQSLDINGEIYTVAQLKAIDNEGTISPQTYQSANSNAPFSSNSSGSEPELNQLDNSVANSKSQSSLDQNQILLPLKAIVQTDATTVEKEKRKANRTNTNSSNSTLALRNKIVNKS